MLHENFIHLHTVSGYSFKFGTASPADLVAAASRNGFTSLALTDRDTLAGTIRFAKSCMAHEITPIIGITIKFLSEHHRVTLLARSSGGYSSLVRLISAIKLKLAHNEKPVLQRADLAEYADLTQNLFLLHGPDSLLQESIAGRQPELALRHLAMVGEAFPHQVIECVSHLAPIGPRSTPLAARALGFARDHGIRAVLSNDVRMIERSDAPLADILDAVRHLSPLHEKNVKRMNAEAFLKSSSEMFQVAKELAYAAGERSPDRLLIDTREVAEASMLSPRHEIGIGEIHLPEPEMVGARDRDEMVQIFRQRCFAGLNIRYSNQSDDRDYQRIRTRLDDEIDAIRILGFESYFLTVADITEGARELGIRTAARGSGAGSLVCYLLGIGSVDPLAHGLIMERFCSPLRKELPDIDIDVESARRLEIYDLVFARYGAQVATVAMVDKYRARHAIRDVGMALAISPVEIDLIAKSLPHVRARRISEVIAKLPELRAISKASEDSALLKMAFGLAERLDSLPRNLAMHPCAVAISDKRFPSIAPLEINASGYPMIAFDKDDVEDIGLLKLDILGVRMQSALAYTVDEIKRVEGKTIDIDQVPLDDAKTFELIQSTKTLGLFQIESPGQRELVGKFAPKTFNDLIIDISLFRPGPVKSDMISPFLNARHGHAATKRIHPDLDPILDETEGVVVFHEQVIRIIAVMTGISLAEGDERRRELGTPEGQQRVCDWFYPRARDRGYPLEVVDEVWQVLRAFASFGFCKAHATAFALPTYQSAWLKAHYPAFFLAGVLNHDPGMYPKRLILDEVRQWGISIVGIDVNHSDREYRVSKKDDGFAIRLALTELQGISEGEVASIIDHRPYSDLTDFIYRSGASRPIAEALILVGGFESIYGIDANPRDLLLHLGDIYRLSQSKEPKISPGQISLGFRPEFQVSGLPNLTKGEQVRNEIDLLGMEVSHHLMEFYADFLNQIGAVRSSDLLKLRSQSEVLVAGVKVALQTPPIRSGERVIFLTLSDGYGCSDITFFADAQEHSAELLYSSSLLLVRGVTRRTGARGISLRALRAWDLAHSYERWRSVAVCE
jgi:error-prone DNA polymerase